MLFRSPELRGRAFAVREARVAKVSLERLRRGDLVTPFPGVRVTAELHGHADRARAYAPRLRPDGFLSHTSAATLLGLPLPTVTDPRIHVSLPHGARAVRTPGVIGHHLVIAADEITVLDGIRVTTPERTWCDLAGWIPFDDLVAAGDRLLWRHDPLATREALAEMVHRHPGRRGRRDRVFALPLLSERADSSPETKLRCAVIRSGFPEPEVNPVLRGPAGEWIGQPDLALVSYGEVLEYEGDGHRTDRTQWRSDLARVPRFEAFDWHVIRVGGDDLRDGFRRVLDILEHRLLRAGWTGTRRS